MGAAAASSQAGSCWEELLWNGDSAGIRLERAGHSATVVDHDVFVIAGRKGSTFYQDVLCLSYGDRKWNLLCETLPFPARANHTATLVGTKIWLIGGSNNEVVMADVHVYDTASGQWSTPEIRGNKELLVRSAHACDLHPTRRTDILIFGGYGGCSSSYTWLRDLVVLHTDSCTVEPFDVLGSMVPSARGYHSFNTLGNRPAGAI